jgi:hypothetical protein
MQIRLREGEESEEVRKATFHGLPPTSNLESTYLHRDREITPHFLP